MNKNRDPSNWWDYSVNAVVGCSMNCTWPGGGRCWARVQARRSMHHCELCGDFTPHLHLDRLRAAAGVKSPSVMALSLMGEPFDPTFTRIGRQMLFDYTAEIPERHSVVWLTKRPDLIDPALEGFMLRSNWWFLVSAHDKFTSAERYHALSRSRARGPAGLHLEPICGPVDLSLEFNLGIRWVVIGGLTPLSRQHPETASWTRDVVYQCSIAGVPCWVKGNVPRDGWPRERPALQGRRSGL